MPILVGLRILDFETFFETCIVESKFDMQMVYSCTHVDNTYQHKYCSECGAKFYKTCGEFKVKARPDAVCPEGTYQTMYDVDKRLADIVFRDYQIVKLAGRGYFIRFSCQHDLSEQLVLDQNELHEFLAVFADLGGYLLTVVVDRDDDD